MSAIKPQADEKDTEEQSVPVTPAVAVPEAQVEQPDQFALRDLSAQEEMAFWAMWMFIAALATFVITSIGTVLIWRQVSLTRKAVLDTSEATLAMREANTIARDALVAQSRAWLKVKMVDVSKLRYHFEDADIVLTGEVTFVIENTGHSAASNIWSRSAVGEARGIWTELLDDEEHPHYPEALPPGGTTRSVTELHFRVSPSEGQIDLKPLRAGISINYSGGGQDQFTTECLYSIASWPDGETGWNEKSFKPYFGESMSLEAHAKFLYYRAVS